MIYFELNGQRLSLGLIALGVGGLLSSIFGLGLSVVSAEPNTYFKIIPFVFILGSTFTIALPFPTLWRWWSAKMEAEAKEFELRKRNAEKEINVKPIDAATLANNKITRVVPLSENGNFKTNITVEEFVSDRDLEWHNAAIKFAKCAAVKKSFLGKDLLGYAVTKPEHWVSLTNYLAAGGYVTKQNGNATRINPNWSFEGVVLDLQNGAPLPHPDEDAPNVLQS